MGNYKDMARAIESLLGCFFVALPKYFVYICVQNNLKFNFYEHF